MNTTPITFASTHGNITVVKYLHESGANNHTLIYML
jgi:ankyrin repeat protein